MPEKISELPRQEGDGAARPTSRPSTSTRTSSARPRSSPSRASSPPRRTRARWATCTRRPDLPRRELADRAPPRRVSHDRARDGLLPSLDDAMDNAERFVQYVVRAHVLELRERPHLLQIRRANERSWARARDAKGWRGGNRLWRVREGVRVTARAPRARRATAVLRQDAARAPQRARRQPVRALSRTARAVELLQTEIAKDPTQWQFPDVEFGTPATEHERWLAEKHFGKVRHQHLARSSLFAAAGRASNPPPPPPPPSPHRRRRSCTTTRPRSKPSTCATTTRTAARPSRRWTCSCRAWAS